MMESQNKARNGRMDGVEGRVKVESQRTVGQSELILRVLAFVLTLVAAILLGVDKQTEVVPISITSTLPPLNVAVTAKWHYLSAFVYFVVTNAIACSYAAVSLILSIPNKDGNRGFALLTTVLDMVMVALLFSSNGAATAIGVIGYNGNSHVNWNKVCNVFDKFCHQVAASVVLSLAAASVFMVLVVLAASGLHKRCN